MLSGCSTPIAAADKKSSSPRPRSACVRRVERLLWLLLLCLLLLLLLLLLLWPLLLWPSVEAAAGQLLQREACISSERCA